MAVSPTNKRVLPGKVHPKVGAVILSLLGLVSLWLFLTPVKRVQPVMEVARASALLVTLYGAVQYSSANASSTMTCGTEGVTFTLSDNPLYSAQMVLASPLLKTDKPHFVALGEGTELSVQLLGTNDAVYRVFRAAEGRAEFTPKQGRLSAILYDDAAEQLLVNAVWSCREARQ